MCTLWLTGLFVHFDSLGGSFYFIGTEQPRWTFLLLVSDFDYRFGLREKLCKSTGTTLRKLTRTDFSSASANSFVQCSVLFRAVAHCLPVGVVGGTKNNGNLKHIKY